LRCGRRQAGISFIELIMFIVIVSLGIAGILSVLNLTAQKSADPMVRKQMLAIAEALLEEVELMPFTYCDPNDANARTAGAALVGGANCQATVEAIGPVAGETRYSAVTPFDNVDDYDGFDTNTATPSGIWDPSATLAGPAGYRAQVAVSTQALGPAGLQVAATDGNGAPQSLVINVTVTGPGGGSIVLGGYRTRYAPNAVP
jgi:MSHA pilin protein MshD